MTRIYRNVRWYDGRESHMHDIIMVLSPFAFWVAVGYLALLWLTA